ncbi:MAG: ABC transporter ATP-binding protein [Syntrophaceae bacterium]|nr:ABC transporter ATP-binding protein [Syntrophaceae bacterium]
MALAIRAEGIYKSFRSGWWGQRRKEVLKGVDLQVEQGEIFGILGPNGAGKTTLLSILSTLLFPDRGKVEILGIDGLRDGHRIREKVNISSGNANFLWSLSVRENLHFYGMLYGLTGKAREEKVKALIEFFDLKGHEHVPFDRLSTGMKQRLSLAKSMLNDPQMLFLDEPTVGLDPEVSVRIREKIRSAQRENGMTILLTTHNMREAESLCDRIAFLKEGEIVALGSAGALKRMVRIGDVVRIEFNGPISCDQIIRAEGVINCSISGDLCEIIVDEGESRLASLIAIISQGGAQIKRVSLGQTDLEDVFIEFAKGTDSDMGLRI